MSPFMGPHTEEKVFNHEVENETFVELMCEKSFPQGSVLKTHMITHTLIQKL